MSERENINSIEYCVESNSCDTQLSDYQIRSIKNEGKYRNEYVELLDRHLVENSFPSFAGRVKVNESTLYLWMKKYPEFAAVHKKYLKKKTKLYA